MEIHIIYFIYLLIYFLFTVNIKTKLYNKISIAKYVSSSELPTIKKFNVKIHIYIYTYIYIYIYMYIIYILYIYIYKCYLKFQ